MCRIVIWPCSISGPVCNYRILAVDRHLKRICNLLKIFIKKLYFQAEMWLCNAVLYWDRLVSQFGRAPQSLNLAGIAHLQVNSLVIIFLGQILSIQQLLRPTCHLLQIWFWQVTKLWFHLKQIYQCIFDTISVRDSLPELKFSARACLLCKVMDFDPLLGN